jgi:hypothetical protein
VLPSTASSLTACHDPWPSVRSSRRREQQQPKIGGDLDTERKPRFLTCVFFSIFLPAPLVHTPGTYTAIWCSTWVGGPLVS